MNYGQLEIFAPFAVTVVDFLEVGQTFTAARILGQPAYKITCVVNPFAMASPDAKKIGYTVEKVGE